MNRSWLAAPVFEDEALTERARVLHAVCVTSFVLVTVLVPILVVVQPDHLQRGLRVIGVVGAAAVAGFVLNRRGRTTLASWLYVGLVLALVGGNAFEAGGIRSPGVQALLVFVMVAGLLLGERGGMITAALAAALGLVLVLLERAGVIAPTTIYGPWALWLLNCIYIGLALATMRAAIRALRRALAGKERQLAERKATQTRLEHALEAGDIGVFAYDPESQRFTADRRLLTLLGLQPDADGTVAYGSWRRLVHPDDIVRVEADLVTSVADRARGRIQYRLAHPELGERILEAATYATTDDAGTARSIVGLTMDVTQRRRAEQERVRLVRDLGERVKELRLLHDASMLLRQHKTVDHGVLSELVARMPEAWLHTADCRVRVIYQDLEVSSPGWRATPWMLSAEFRTSAGPGRVEVAYLNELPTADEGPFLSEERELINSLAELLRSRIEESAAEHQRRGLETQLRQAQKMDALGTLVGGIAHDFNNILTAIGINADLAQGELAPESPAHASIVEITKAQARARDLVRRILLFSRQQETDRKAISLPAVVDEALHLLRASLPPGIAVKSTFAPRLPSVLADVAQIHQVLMNLGTNAGYAMQETGGELIVRVDHVASSEEVDKEVSLDLRPGPQVRIAVRDTGSGMSPQVLERLFEPFFSTKGIAGAGLGLAVVHGIVRDHGGAITVDSAPGRGTEFRIWLPAVAAPQAAPTAVASGIVRGNGEHIMYVDDDEAITYVMTRTLERMGYRSTGFTDAEEALQEFRTAPHAYDAVITDLQMPRMSGLVFTAAVRAIRADVSVAIASGVGREHDAGEGTEQVTVWINKPSTLIELGQTLQRLVSCERD